ncbi:MAG: serine protease [Halieaceae bacterium]|jgi:hypothetical protein|nr:serine protease [Halieaceae bacterium]
MASTDSLAECARWLLVGLLAAPLIAIADPRLRAEDAPRDWTRAVVRLQTPTRASGMDQPGHRIEHCTATLVRGGAHPLLVTAWHCVEGRFDLTRPPRAEINGRWYALDVLTSGGDMSADWAIVTTVEKAPAPAVLPLYSGSLDAGTRITAGGFSRDDTLGATGEYLTYHENCQVVANKHADSLSDCLAFKGASGGPVILGNPDEGYRFAGVISAGDSLTRSILVPLSRFIRKLNALM